MYLMIDDHYFIHPDVAPTWYVELCPLEISKPLLVK